MLNKYNVFYSNTSVIRFCLQLASTVARTLYVNFDVFEVFGLNLLVPTTIRYPLGDVSFRPKQSDGLPLSRKRYSYLYSFTMVPGDAPDTNGSPALSTFHR